MAGRIQNSDVKSVAELISGGATAAELPNDTKIWVTASGINKTLSQAIIDGNIGGNPVCGKESALLDATDISNGYVDLTVEALANSLIVTVNRQILNEGVDYTTSVVSLVTRVTWAGDFMLGGQAELVENDNVYFQFIVA